MTATQPQTGVPKSWERACQAMLVAGAVAFAAALLTGNGPRAWHSYLLNFLFWTGIAQCGVIFSAGYRITKGGWSDALRRMGESMAFFLPVSAVLFIVLMAFGAEVFPWSEKPYPGLEGWLNVPAVLARGLAVMAAVFGLSLLYVYHSQRPAIRAAHAAGMLRPGRLLDRFLGGPAADDEARTTNLAPAVVLAFALGFTLIGFDMVMSLDSHAHNTMFGWYFYVGAFYSMLAFMALSVAIFRRPWGLERHLTADQSHDLGKLLFGICLLTGGFLWAQWLVFWYGNLPHEVEYVRHRYYEFPFAPYAWTMTYGGFIVPLVVLLSKPLKRNPRRLAWIALWIMAMMWLERYVWIVPAVWHGDSAPLAIELLVTAGFAGGFAWGWIVHNRRFPIAALAALPQARRH
jgi:hypothetical protein